MKKRILLLTLILIFKVGLSIAQTNATEAKAAYLLAEENYGKGDYKAALRLLNNAKKSMGMANSKMLYLEVQIESELLKSDKSHYAALMKTIADFQSAPDIKDFNEEKVLEVVKIKMQLADDHERQLAAENEARAKSEAAKQRLANYSYQNWPLGVNFTELTVSHKDSLIFKKKTKQRVESNGMTLNYHNFIGFFFGTTSYIPNNYMITNVFGVLTKDGIVKGYLKQLYNENKSFSKKSYQQTEIDVKTIIDKRTQEFGFVPSVENDTYTWATDSKTVTCYVMRGSTDKGYWTCMVVEKLSTN